MLASSGGKMERVRMGWRTGPRKGGFLYISLVTASPFVTKDEQRRRFPASRQGLSITESAHFQGRRGTLSKIEARLRFVDDKDLMFLSEVLKVPVQELFPRRENAGRLSEFMEKLESTRF